MTMERHGPLVSAETAFENLEAPGWVFFDCRHDLADPQAGPLSYGRRHLPGAYHAHLDQDLSDPVGDGTQGRHPLPDPERFQAFLRRHGVGPDTQVVCYDEGPGMWAARLWWLLRYHGHEAVAVLDGGLARWKTLRLPTSDNPAEPVGDGDLDADPGHMPTVDVGGVMAAVEDGRTLRLVDARAPERYRGDEEPLDPVAGHIPGAVNRPFGENIGPDGLWLSPDELRARYEDLSLEAPVAVYCGSGVTAAHDVLAMESSGLPTPALYPGSWSQWCHPSAQRPVERGDGATAEAR